jgi:hypothetical protein
MSLMKKNIIRLDYFTNGKRTLERENYFDAIDRYSPKRLVFIFFLFNMIFKLVLITVNRAEYTDGILQLTLFSSPNKLYPPLFTLCALGLAPLFRSPEISGRFVSVLSSSIILFPLFYFSLRLFNKRAAFFTCLIYTISPVPLRWSLHAMTDALFALLFLAAAIFWLEASGEESKTTGKSLFLATVFSVLATLTRYQGFLFFPPLLFLALAKSRQRKRIFLPGFLMQVLWLAPVLWIVYSGFRHPEQFVERAGQTAFSTMLNILNLFESFLAYSPYFLSWPVFFLFLAGLFYLGWDVKQRVLFFSLFMYLVVTLLLLQSAFSSFQARYLLPLVPLVTVFAGWGMETLRVRWNRHPWLASLVFFITLFYGLGFGLCSVFLQREIFMDLKAGALYVKDLPADTVIYSNEAYKDLGPVKMRFWSGREIQAYDPARDLPSGSVVCLSSAYGGSLAISQHSILFRQRYQPRLLMSFQAGIVPLLPDVMQEPWTHQNPLAITFRYTPQQFRTEIYQIPWE